MSNEPILCGLEYSHQQLERYRNYRQVTKAGVVYDEELAGPGGMSFVLLRELNTTDSMLKDSVSELRRNRDVVGKIKVTAVILPSVS